MRPSPHGRHMLPGGAPGTCLGGGGISCLPQVDPLSTRPAVPSTLPAASPTRKYLGWGSQAPGLNRQGKPCTNGSQQSPHVLG